MEHVINYQYLINALVYSVLGLVILGISILIVDRLTPGTLWKEIIEEHNIALAIIVGATTIAIAIIISAAIHE